MEITTKYYLDRISNSPNKNNWRVRKMIKEINILISNYRLTAMNSKGYIRKHCNIEADYLEKQLNFALGKGRKLN